MFSALTKSTKHFLTAFVLLLMGLLVAEIVLQFTLPPSVSIVSSQVPNEAQSAVVPSATVHHELRRLSTIQIGSGPEFNANSLGLRGPEPDRRNLKRNLRIVVLGDETVLGASHSDDRTMPALLQKFLAKSTGRPVEVINAGVPGYCPLLSLIQYRESLLQLSPSIVVLHFDMTDVADDQVYRRLLRRSEGQQICPNLILNPPSETASSWGKIANSSTLLRFATMRAGIDTTNRPFELTARYEWMTTTREDLRLPIQHSLSSLEDLASESEKTGVPLLVSTSPMPWQVAASEHFPETSASIPLSTGWPLTDDRPNKILAAVCERHTIMFCDTTLAFRDFESPEQLFNDDSTELSAYGNSLYAREVAALMLKTPTFASVFQSDTPISIGSNGVDRTH